VKPIALGWRVHAASAVVVAVTGSADAPEVVHRETVTLLDDPVLCEPYHAAVGRELDDARALIASVQEAAADAAAAAVRGFMASLGPVTAVGVVGGNRRLPDLARILTKHALLHAAERNLYEEAIIAGATRAGLPVTTVPATGTLFADASERLGVDLVPVLAALGKAIGPPWQKDQKEATAAALVALCAPG
jgi:hypothetical protein